MNPVTRSRTAAALLLGFIPLGLAWALIWPDNLEESKALFASAAAHDSAWKLAATLFVLSFAVAVPGLTTLSARVSGRDRTLVPIGGLLGAVGFVCNTIAGTFSAYLGLLAVQPDRAAMVHIWDGLGTIPLTVGVSILIIVGHLGLILLAFGLRRARLTGWWAPITMLVGMLSEALIGPANHWAEVATVALVGAAFVGFARALVREPARSGSTRLRCSPPPDRSAPETRPRCGTGAPQTPPRGNPTALSYDDDLQPDHRAREQGFDATDDTSGPLPSSSTAHERPVPPQAADRERVAGSFDADSGATPEPAPHRR